LFFPLLFFLSYYFFFSSFLLNLFPFSFLPFTTLSIHLPHLSPTILSSERRSSSSRVALIVVQIFPPRSAPAPTAPGYLHLWRQHATATGCLLPTPLQPPSAPHGARPLHSCVGQSPPPTLRFRTLATSGHLLCGVALHVHQGAVENRCGGGNSIFVAISTNYKGKLDGVLAEPGQAMVFGSVSRKILHREEKPTAPGWEPFFRDLWQGSVKNGLRSCR
jgi:hypothetical protein